MASVFLSYDREDGDRARLIAAALEKAGHSVWWDRHIRGGAQYSKEIEQALKQADAVVVLWSARSVDSPWVRDEAASGRDSGRLVPVRIDPTEPPLGFRQYQSIDLSSWKGRSKSGGLAALLDAVSAAGGQSPAPESAKAIGGRPQRTIPLRLIGVMIIVALIAASAFLLLRSRGDNDIQTVVVTAADQSPAARTLARALLVSLGNLQSAKADQLRLVGQSDQATRRADLIFEASAASNPGVAGANLVLLSGNDRAVLWSRDFKQGSGNHADLQQQIAFTAARILGCASEGLAAEGKGLDAATLKQYLNVCAQLAEISPDTNMQVVPVLLQVVKKAPRLEAAWANLLFAEADEAKSSLSGRIEPSAAAALRAHLAEARKVNPAMPAVAIVEALLLPHRAEPKPHPS